MYDDDTIVPTKLRKGNVFSHVCASVHRGFHVNITHHALDLNIQVPSGHVKTC